MKKNNYLRAIFVFPLIIYALFLIALPLLYIFIISFFKSDSYGGPVWMMAKNPQNHTLACACEDGSIRLFDTSGENIMYLRSIQMLLLF